MSRLKNQIVFALGIVAGLSWLAPQAECQEARKQPYKLLQSAADIASLPKAPSDSQRQSVQAGFAPQQSASQSGYQGSFYLQGNNSNNNNQQVYPYPASNQPRQSAATQSAFALSQGSTQGRLSNQISIGSNTSTGNLRPSRLASNEPFPNSLQVAPTAASPATAIPAPVNQQASSALNAAEQARINQAAVERFRLQQSQLLAQQNELAQVRVAQAQTAQAQARVAQAQAQAAQVQAAQAQAVQAQATQVRVAQAQVQANAQAAQAASNQNAFRQTAFQSNPNLRVAQNCCTPSNQTSVGYQAPFQSNPNLRVAQNCCTPNNQTSAGYQAAFQAPAINPNVGAGIGLGLNTPLNNGQQAFSQFAQQSSCCQPQAQAQGGFGFQQGGFQQGGFQTGGFQQGGFGLGGIGTPQFGAQGARWWTPFFTGTGNYSPLLRLVQNNAGTYLGQGLIGQPTAYVSGQPLRNLLRYIAP